MIRSLLIFTLLLASIPNAHAAPPCPKAPVVLTQLSDPSTPIVLSALPWFNARYTQVDTANMLPSLQAPWLVNTGKCRKDDSLIIPENRASSGRVGIHPLYATRAAFGMVVLPEMPSIPASDLQVKYTLSFTVDNTLLADGNDWLDILQLDFLTADTSPINGTAAASSLYRLRKITNGKSGLPMLQMIESRPANDSACDIHSNCLPCLACNTDRVVASIPLQGLNNVTPIALRWTTHNMEVSSSIGQATSVGSRIIHSVLEILGPNNVVMYTVTLPNEWANTFSMGLLDYNIYKAADYPSSGALKLGNMEFGAQQL